MSELTKGSFNFTEKLIILDRDGVINYDSVNYIRTPEEWHPIPGSLEAIVRLKKAGFRVAVATNQSGIGRGYYTEKTLQAMHQKMQDALAAVAQEKLQIDAIFYCPHLPTDNCECRKPKPGLLKKIAEHFQCSLIQVPFIGDNLSDVQTALAVGAAPILIQSTESPHYPYPCVANLSDAVDALLGVVS
jgi:D-glycero-D-manno-heptose 1,7-bisphosphate phosphatase